MNLEHDEAGTALDGDSALVIEGREDLPAFEGRGWTSRSEDCAPKISALASLANLEPSAALAQVSYVSRGNLLVVGGDDAAAEAAARLSASLPVTLLLTSRPSAQAPVLARLAERDARCAFPVWAGRPAALSGFLGNFTITIDGLTVVREGADGRAAVPAGAAQAVFDLVLDFSDPPLFAIHTPPQGYWRVAGDTAALESALVEAPDAVGEFEKPKFFGYRDAICAHARSGIVGCSQCIDICSTDAIRPDGDKVAVDPHLCMGCGACATVCPSGAMSYLFPRLADRGLQLKQLLSAYRQAGGRDACILFHNGTDGRELLAAAAAQGRGLPARVIPLEAWHVAAIGPELLLSAIAFGASQVAVLCAGSESPDYVRALRTQMALAETVLAGLGYAGTHFLLVESGEPGAATGALADLEPAPAVAMPATFLVSSDKRTAVEFAVEHLARHAPAPSREIALPAGSPFGEVRVDRAKCTMCMACAGACPESALMDGVDQPILKFLERNCVQCGLCERTCPENAITLSPRLLLAPSVREARVLNETQPFHCVSCGKPFGTKQMVDAMLGRLAGHSMFSGGEALRRLQMCADCRVVDMMSSKDEVSVLKLGGKH